LLQFDPNALDSISTQYLKYSYNILCSLNKRWRIPKGQSKNDNLEKLATRRRQTKQKHSTLFLDTTICKQTQIL